jgi:hypothetical protein
MQRNLEIKVPNNYIFVEISRCRSVERRSVEQTFKHPCPFHASMHSRSLGMKLTSTAILNYFD